MNPSAPRVAKRKPGWIDPKDRKPSERNPAGRHTGSGKYIVFLYVVACEDFVKIGISERPDLRVCAMRTGCPFPIELLAHHPLSPEDAVAAETAVLLSLEPFHSTGDWFRCSQELALSRAARSVEGMEPPRGLSFKGERQPRARHNSNRRPVMTPAGRFESATLAAAHFGISKIWAFKQAQLERNGWRYLPSEGEQWAAPALAA